MNRADFFFEKKKLISIWGLTFTDHFIPFFVVRRTSGCGARQKKKSAARIFSPNNEDFTMYRGAIRSRRGVKSRWVCELAGMRGNAHAGGGSMCCFNSPLKNNFSPAAEPLSQRKTFKLLFHRANEGRFLFEALCIYIYINNRSYRSWFKWRSLKQKTKKKQNQNRARVRTDLCVKGHASHSEAESSYFVAIQQQLLQLGGKWERVLAPFKCAQGLKSIPVLRNETYFCRSLLQSIWWVLLFS